MDKLLTKKVCQDAGIKIPAYIHTYEALHQCPEGFSFPLILKPLSEGSSIDVLIVDTEEELKKQDTIILDLEDEIGSLKKEKEQQKESTSEREQIARNLNKAERDLPRVAMTQRSPAYLRQSDQLKSRSPRWLLSNLVLLR